MSERFGYLVPEYPGQTHVMFWRELVQLRTLGLDPRPVTTRAPVAALQAHAWAAQEAASTPRLHPVPTREQLIAEVGTQESGAAGHNRGRHGESIEAAPARERTAYEGFTASPELTQTRGRSLSILPSDCRSFQARPAFSSTIGRKAQLVRP